MGLIRNIIESFGMLYIHAVKSMSIYLVSFTNTRDQMKSFDSQSYSDSISLPEKQGKEPAKTGSVCLRWVAAVGGGASR
jgi:hypothetical protein